MTTPAAAGSREELISRAWRGQRLRRLLLLAGIAAGAVYAVGDLVSGLLYDGYSWRDQAISELSAYGSQVRPLSVTWISLQALLSLAFCVGIWWSANGGGALRWTAGFLLAAGVVTTPLHPFFPMTSRGMETGFNDTMHLALTMAFGPLVCAAVVASAVAFRGWFRLYVIVSVLVMVAGAGLTGPLMGDIANSRPTPWLGTFERINAYAMFLWMAVLALVLLHRTVDSRRRGAEPEQMSPPAAAGRPMVSASGRSASSREGD